MGFLRCVFLCGRNLRAWGTCPSNRFKHACYINMTHIIHICRQLYLKFRIGTHKLSVSPTAKQKFSPPFVEKFCQTYTLNITRLYVFVGKLYASTWYTQVAWICISSIDDTTRHERRRRKVKNVRITCDVCQCVSYVCHMCEYQVSSNPKPHRDHIESVKETLYML